MSANVTLSHLSAVAQKAVAIEALLREHGAMLQPKKEDQFFDAVAENAIFHVMMDMTNEDDSVPRTDDYQYAARLFWRIRDHEGFCVLITVGASTVTCEFACAQCANKHSTIYQAITELVGHSACGSGPVEITPETTGALVITIAKLFRSAD